MAGEIGVSFTGIPAVTRRLTGMPRRLDQAERESVRVGSLEALALFRRKVTGAVLKVRSGAYRDATTSSPPAKDGAGWMATVGVKDGPAAPYAKIHETGGTIRAKKKYLTIPVGEALTPAGVPRFDGPLDPALDSRDVFWIFPKGKKPRVVESDENDELTTLFIAVPEVRIPARRPLGTTLEEMRPRMRVIAQEELVRVIAADAQ